jgi:hypothetical protein
MAMAGWTGTDMLALGEGWRRSATHRVRAHFECAGGRGCTLLGKHHPEYSDGYGQRDRSDQPSLESTAWVMTGSNGRSLAAAMSVIDDHRLKQPT